MRDHAWLQDLLDRTWDNHFAEVPQANDVRIEFGRKAKRRLGSIRIDPTDRTTSIITMNGLFKSEQIPEFVIQATLVHELTHYAQGFNSPLPQSQRHPHAGGVMRREFAERGLLQLFLDQKKWLKLNWPMVIATEMPSKPKKIVRRTSSQTDGIKIPKPFWFK